MTTSDLWERLNRTPLTLDGTSQMLVLDEEEVARVYEPVARRALEAQPSFRGAHAVCGPVPSHGGLQRGETGCRALVAIAGPPGSGKTAFATTLTAVVNALAGQESAAMVGLDGWHYPNAYLDSHMIRRGAETLVLRLLKGAVETYDQHAIAGFLAAARDAHRLPYPVYSRELHDPVAGAGVLERWHRIVLMEGNYWLLDEPPWNTYRTLFDLRIFLSAMPESLLAGLAERHRRGGKSPEFIVEHMSRVDRPNIEQVLARSGPADVVVHKADGRRISRVAYCTA